MNEKKYFDIPTQVCFWDFEEQYWHAGIAWGQNVICGCCGGVFEIDEVWEFAPAEVGNPIREFNYWVDLSDEIAGNTWPEDPFEKEDYPPDEELCEMEAWYFQELQDKVN